MKYRPYEKYKPSGIEWLGDVPAHWEIYRIKHTTRVKGRIGWQGLRFEEFTDEGPYLVTGTDFEDGYIDWSACYHISEERYNEDPYIQLRNDDLLITKDGTIGKVAIVRQLPCRASLNSGVFLTRPKKAVYITRYMYWVLCSAVFHNFIEFQKSGTTIDHLYQNVFVEFEYPAPPIDEQCSISEFVDAATKKIHALLDKKKDLIVKLKEKRTALISHSVTRGLQLESPHPRSATLRTEVQSSAAKWFRDIPEHWETKPLKFVARVGNGSTPSRENQDYWLDGSYPWLNSSVVNQDEVLEASDFVTERALGECHLPVVRPPAVLVGITGEGKTRGMATTLRIEATINQHLAFLKPNETTFDVSYLRRVLDRSYQFLRSESDGGGSTKGAITCEQLGNLRVPVPPFAEQRVIADYLDCETAKIDQMVEKVEAAIERLQEYRTALITAAVTGKIDVRAKHKSKA